MCSLSFICYCNCLNKTREILRLSLKLTQALIVSFQPWWNHILLDDVPGYNWTALSTNFVEKVHRHCGNFVSAEKLVDFRYS